MIAQLQNGPRRRNLIIEEQDEDSLQNAQRELEHLEHGKILLKGVHEAKRRPQVVEVHEGVNEAVDPCAKKCGSIADTKVQEQAPDKPDCHMVIQMQERELVAFLAQHHEERVKHVEKLRDVVHHDPELDAPAVLAIDVKEVILKERKEPNSHES